MKNEEKKFQEAHSPLSAEALSPQLLMSLRDIREERVELLNLIITIQRFMLLDTIEHNYTEEYLNQQDGNLMTLQSVIMNA